jgi:hypothetical protein
MEGLKTTDARGLWLSDEIGWLEDVLEPVDFERRLSKHSPTRGISEGRLFE